MPLPAAKTSVEKTLGGHFWLFYGPPKIGKSTLASQFEDKGNAIFLVTEEGHRHLSIYKRMVRNWKDFQKAVTELQGPDGRRFSTVVVDTVSNLFLMCRDHVCEHRGLEHPSDEDFSKGWDILSAEFTKHITRLSQLGKGIVFIAHDTTKDVSARGMRIPKTLPHLPSTCYRAIVPLVDVIGYCGFDANDRKRRIIVFEPEEDLVAGDRTAMLPAWCDLSYQALKQAWGQGPRKVVGPVKRLKHVVKHAVVRKGPTRRAQPR